MKSQSETLYSERVERLETVRIAKEVNQIQFAKMLGIKPASYSDIKMGRSGISKNVMWKLENELNVSIKWLLTGTGEMELVNNTTDIPKEESLKAQNIPKSFSNEAAGLIKQLYQIIEKKDQQIHKKDEQIDKVLEMIERRDAQNKTLLELLAEKLEASNELVLSLTKK